MVLPILVRWHLYVESGPWSLSTAPAGRSGSRAVSLPALHYGDVIVGAMASQITSLTIVYSTVYSAADQRKHQSSASLAFVRGIHRWSVNSPHKWPVTRKMFPFDDVIMSMWFVINLTNEIHGKLRQCIWLSFHMSDNVNSRPGVTALDLKFTCLYTE